jgi:hypothetical protein
MFNFLKIDERSWPKVTIQAKLKFKGHATVYSTIANI